MAERMLIVKVVRTNGTRADLFAKGHKWPDLKLFDLGELAAVGLDPNSLQVGQEVPCRFWALWEYSEKTNQAGNRYKDVLTLKPVDSPATLTSTDNSALLAELRAIRGLLEVLANAQGFEPALSEAEVVAEVDSVSELDRAIPRYGDGSTVSDNPAEREYFQAHLKAEGQPPASVKTLRAWVLAKKNGNG